MTAETEAAGSARPTYADGGVVMDGHVTAGHVAELDRARAAALERVAALEASLAEVDCLRGMAEAALDDMIRDRDTLAARLAAVRKAVEARRVACAGMARLDENDRAYGEGMDVALAFVLALLDAPATPTGPKDGE